jgi:Arc/MetJ-type ribon-helix-helix transcriptional regulator
MTIELPQDLAELVNEKLENGAFATPVDVVRDALEGRHDDEITWITPDQLRRDYAAAVEQMERGEYITYPNGGAAAEDAMARGRALLTERTQAKR